MTEKADAETMDLMVKMITEEGGDIGKPGSIDLDLDMSEFVAESRVESIIINNVRNDAEMLTTKAMNDTVSTIEPTELVAGTSDKTDAKMLTDLRVATPTALESKSVEIPAIGTQNLGDESDKRPVSETTLTEDFQSESILSRDAEHDVIKNDSKPYVAAKIDVKHRCLACYYCPNSLNPKLRQFTRLEQKIINHITEYRDLVLNQPIIILERCDNLAKTMQMTTKRCLDIDKPGIVRENCFEEKKKHLEKEMKAKIKKISAEKAKAKEVDAQKSLYSKLLKKHPPIQLVKNSSAEKTAKLHSVPKLDLHTK
uniref:Uncharacterized protein n=1 Tax=Romanomermis culicivorax TaxID=13658 RepID=A0A915KVM9_ROMCU